MLIYLVIFLCSSVRSAPIKSIDLGFLQTCIISGDWQLSCWGSNTLLKEGFSEIDSPKAINVFPLTKDVKLASSYSCALSQEGAAKCWGKLPGKADPLKGIHQPPTLMRIPTPVIQMALSSESFCFLSGSQVYCRGKKNLTESVKYEGTDEFRLIDLPSDATQISSSNTSFCANLITGEAWCWGPFESNSPVKLAGLDESINMVETGPNGHCVSTTSNHVFCWDYHFKDRKPVKVLGIEEQVVGLSSDSFVTCAVLKSGEVKCWGRNYNGELGQSEKVKESKTALKISGIEGAVGVRVGDDIACALFRDDKVKCWGSGFKILNNGNGAFLPPYELVLP